MIIVGIYWVKNFTIKINFPSSFLLFFNNMATRKSQITYMIQNIFLLVSAAGRSVILGWPLGYGGIGTRQSCRITVINHI